MRRSKAIRGLGRRALAISATRMMNYGLILISPMILVRLLSLEEFGRYREFLVYATLMGGIAAFGVNSSLLRFIPNNPEAGWRFVNQAVLMTLASSMLVVTGMLTLTSLVGGGLVGGYAVPLAVYVLLFVNMDFWEFLWLAEKRASAVLRYTTARLVARIALVTTSAALTRDVTTIIWSIICLEAVRLTFSVIGWRVRGRAAPMKQAPRWREQLQYCLPFGAALVVVTITKSLGSLFVAKMMGPAALAQFVIGTYLQPVINVVRNSLSDVVLPEMSSRNAATAADRLRLWRRSTVVTAIVLFGASVLLARFAEVVIVTLFSETYRPAAMIFQIYVLTFVRETFDFGVPLRAINRNAPILHANLIALALRATLMLALIPLWGLVGAVVAMVASRFTEGSYLAVQAARALDVPLRELAPWKDLLRIMGVAVLAGVVLFGEFWTEHMGVFGLIPASVAYLATFAFLLRRLDIPEADLLLKKLRAAPGLVLRRRAQ